jgi:hypothetical protein
MKKFQHPVTSLRVELTERGIGVLKRGEAALQKTIQVLLWDDRGIDKTTHYLLSQINVAKLTPAFQPFPGKTGDRVGYEQPAV